MKKIGVALIVLILMITICTVDGKAQDIYDDQDGHREPWSDWVKNKCVDTPHKIMDCKECNPRTMKGVTVWMCRTAEDRAHNVAFYTTHWYCTIDESVIRHYYYLPLITGDME